MQYHVHCHFWINADSPKQAAQKIMTEVIEVIGNPEQREFDDGIVFRVDKETWFEKNHNPDQSYWIMPDGTVSDASTGK